MSKDKLLYIKKLINQSKESLDLLEYVTDSINNGIPNDHNRNVLLRTVKTHSAMIQNNTDILKKELFVEVGVYG